MDQKYAFQPDLDQPGRVLVVDDDDHDRELLRQQLEGEPFQLTLAATGEEALALCRTTLFETILSDIALPGVDGLEFCRRLKQTPNAHTPFVFLSGHEVGEAWITRSLDAGALDYLPKPCSLPVLLAKLRVMVRLSRQQAFLSESERQTALLEVAGGAAHELSQPLASARLLLDLMERQREPPSPGQMSQLRDFVDRTASILEQIRGLKVYVTKPYPSSGPILDLERSSEISGMHEGYQPSKRNGKE